MFLSKLSVYKNTVTATTMTKFFIGLKILSNTRIKAAFALAIYLTLPAIYLHASHMKPANVKEEISDVRSTNPEMTYSIVHNKSSVDNYYDLDFEMYPNPSRGGPINLEIDGIHSNMVEITLYNTIGKVLLKKNVTSATPFASLSIKAVEKLPPGLYFVSISSNDEKVAKKLIIRE